MKKRKKNLHAVALAKLSNALGMTPARRAAKVGRPRDPNPSRAALYQRARRERLRKARASVDSAQA